VGDAKPRGPNCAAVVGAMFTASQRLVALLPALRVAHEQYGALESSVQQRLSWACGSNRQLSQSLNLFSTAVASRAHAVQFLAKTCNMLSGLANVLAHFETYRVCSADPTRTRSADIGRLDSANLTCVHSLRVALVALEEILGKQAVFEEQLPARLKLVAPHGQITRDWLRSRTEAIPGLISAANSQLSMLQESARCQAPVLSDLMSGFQLLSSSVESLMNELDPLLAPLVKAGSRQACATATAHRSFAATLTIIVGCCGSIKGAVVAGFSAVNPIAISADSEMAGQNPVLQARVLFESVRALEAIDATDDMAAPVNEEPLDAPGPKTVLADQERNAQATAVWRRVRAKLEGKDSDGIRRGTSEQVDTLIREAVSESRLCRMYEGWAPWI
jgi:hypothetical protein